MRRGFLNTDSNRPKKSVGAKVPVAERKAVVPILSTEVTSSDAPDFGDITDPHYVLTSLSRLCPYFQFTDHEPSTAALLFGGMKEKILALPAFSAPFPFPSRLHHYRISPIDGAGLGMFATKDFNPGDLIACDRPLLVAPRGILYGGTMYMDPHDTAIHPHEIVDVLIKQKMSAADRAAFFDLRNCKGSDKLPSAGILDTNALGIGALPGYNGMYGCVCKDISRINHSCSPNAHHYWNLNLFNSECRALRPIRANEQITISYLNNLIPRRERQDELWSKYAFRCACSSCILPKIESLRSDTCRALLASQNPTFDDAELNKWVSDPTAPDDQLIAHSEKILGIMEGEGCCVLKIWPAHVQRLIKAYAALQDSNGVRKWAEKAAALTCAFTGNDKGWMKVFAHPEETAWWGRRTKAGKQTLKG